jgi:hypothetical protein
MTVRTPNLALIDFRRNAIPSHTLTNHVANIRSFLTADVVELKHSGIALAAIDASVESQECVHPLPVARAISRPVAAMIS